MPFASRIMARAPGGAAAHGRAFVVSSRIGGTLLGERSRHPRMADPGRETRSRGGRGRRHGQHCSLSGGAVNPGGGVKVGRPGGLRRLDVAATAGKPACAWCVGAGCRTAGGDRRWRRCCTPNRTIRRLQRDMFDAILDLAAGWPLARVRSKPVRGPARYALYHRQDRGLASSRAALRGRPSRVIGARVLRMLAPGGRRAPAQAARIP
jgi:hypothetical protein